MIQAGWCVSKPNKLHPHIQHKIRWNLPKEATSYSKLIRYAWEYLLESWEEEPRDFLSKLYNPSL